MPDSSITIRGTVGGDPTMIFTTGGRPFTTFSVAVNHRYKPQGASDWEEEAAVWMRCSCWGREAENAAASLSKGDRVIVTGRIKNGDYEKDGVKIKQVELVAEEIGVSIKWDRVEVQRTEREQTGSPARTTSRRQSKPTTPPADPGWSDEEPF